MRVKAIKQLLGTRKVEKDEIYSDNEGVILKLKDWLREEQYLHDGTGVADLRHFDECTEEEISEYMQQFKIVEPKNNGGSTDYYKIPEGAKDLQDLIEFQEMNFAIGNIFKSCYRLGKCNHSDKIRDLNKIIWFAERELKKYK